MLDFEEYNYSLHTLSNGIRLVHRYTPSPVSHCGITIDAGARDEAASENGTAHFVEHCLFKGTAKRRGFQILGAIDGVGGELNAFTTKEETCVYALFLTKYQEKFLELLSDIVFGSTFPASAIEKEKEVILDEINSYLDTPAEQIFDDFEHLLFANHGLGRMILGTPRRVKAMQREQLADFVQRMYTTDVMVLSCVSSMEADKWFALCEKYFGSQPATVKTKRRTPPRTYVPHERQMDEDTYQSHILIGNRAYSYRSEKKTAFALLNNILGSGAMNSYLNMHIREKYGFTYSIESSYTAYLDSGVFCVYASTDKQHRDRTIELIRHELDALCQKKIPPKSLARFKRQLIGQLIVSADQNQSEMLAMGKTLLNFGKLTSLKELCAQVQQVSAEEILDAAHHVFAPEKLSTILYG